MLSGPRTFIAAVAVLLGAAMVHTLYAQAPSDRAGASGVSRATRTPGETPRPPRPGLLWREEWKQTSQGGEHPLSAESVTSPSLELKLYVPSGELLMNGSAGDENNPTHIWTGLCTSPCAVALRDRARFADLSGLARIRWNSKMSGFHQVRPIVKLADGTWLIGDRPTGTPHDWLVSETSYGDLRWLKLDIARVVTVGNFVDAVDLTRVDEIGFADLMPSSGHGPGGWADVAQIEVYGQPVARAPATPVH
jgi:hypothetical protein